MSNTIYKRFRAQNAVSVKTASMPLEDQGLVLIRGENMDDRGSNGSGKTTLFELMYLLQYARTTKTDRRVKKKEYLNVFSPKNFRLQLDLSVDGVPYREEEFRSFEGKKDGVLLYKNGEDITPDDPREARKKIAGLTGLSWNEYLGRVYLSQKYIHTMVEGTAAQKRAYLSQCFGLDAIDTMVKETTKRLNGIPLPDESYLQSMLDSINSDLSSLGDLADLEREFEEASSRQSEVQERLVSLRVELENQESAYSAEAQRQEWIEKLESMKIPTKIPSLKDWVSSARKKQSDLQAKVHNAKRRQQLQSKLGDLREDLPDISWEELERKLSSLESRILSLSETLPGVTLRASLESRLAKVQEESFAPALLKKRLRKWEVKLSETQGKYSSIKAELKKLASVEDVCYTCLRPISSDEKEDMVSERLENKKLLDDAVAHAQEAVDHYRDRLENALQKSSLEKDLEGLPSGEVSPIREELAGCKKQQSELRSVSSALSQAKVLVDQLEELPEVEESLEHLQRDESYLSAALETAEDAYSWLLANGSKKYDPEALQRLRGEHSSLLKELESTNSLLLTYQESLTQIRGLRKQKNEVEKQLNSSSVEKTRSRVLRYLNVSLEGLKKEGLRDSSQLLSKVLPVYLNQLFPNGAIQLDVTDDADGFDLVFIRGGQSIPMTLISGGQAKRVGLAIIFAFAKMGANTTNLLICDEPFRDLDSVGREACFEVLREFNMGTVLVTSHDQDMQSFRRYDQVWTVRMENYVSKLIIP